MWVGVGRLVGGRGLGGFQKDRGRHRGGGSPPPLPLPQSPRHREWLHGGRRQRSPPRLRAPNPGEFIPKVSKKKARQLPGKGGRRPGLSQERPACLPGPGLPGLNASSRRPRGASAGLGRSRARSGRACGPPSNPHPDEGFLPTEPEAGNGHDDSDHAERERDMRQR